MPKPETTAPAAARKPRATWTHADVAGLVAEHHAHPERQWTDRESAKLIELGLLPKPEKPTLSGGAQETADNAVTEVRALDEPQRTLAARYAIGKLRELLPKRKNGET